MQKFIDATEDPAKVAAIQKFFGVSYNRRLPVKSISQNEYTKEESVCMVRRTSLTDSPDLTNIINRENNVNNGSTKNGNHFEPGTKSELDRGENKSYTIKYKVWYYFFISVTYLGDVVGYALVLPFLFWNVDAVIARKLVLVWTAVMYVGQAVKEVVCRGRPECPPVIRLQKRWSEEYGMPSTHAMASVALPASLLYYSSQRYRFRLEFGIAVSLIWCILISFSRLYLGMHSILDIIAGFLLSFVLLIPLLPMMDILGENLVDYTWAPLVMIILSIFFIIVYPKPRGPMSAHTKTDTTIILATCVGVEFGCLLNYQLNIIRKSSLGSYFVIVPDWKTMGFIALRTILGLVCIFISFVIFELVTKFTYWILNKTKVSREDVGSRNRKIPIVDLCLKYLTFCVTSMHVTFSIPYIFKLLNIHRASYLTE